MIPVLRILVPMDFSKESKLAMEWAQMVAGQTPGATVYALHVLPPLSSGFGRVGYQMQRAEAKKRLTEVESAPSGPAICITLTEQGRIPEVIARVCAEKDIDLVIMTTRGRQGFMNFLPESITEDTVRVAPCPVLVLHLNAKNEPRHHQKNKR